MKKDPRLEAFCAQDSLEVFHSIIHTEDIFSSNDFDVDTIHKEAREVYEQLLNRVDSDNPPSSGRILLLKGEAGAGKTHLMQAFRRLTHEHNAGYFSYMQMSSEVPNYPSYLLSKTLDSLNKSYYSPHGATSGLLHLSNALAEDPLAGAESISMIREGELEPKQIAALIHHVANRLVEKERFREQDVDLIHALLYLQKEDPTIDTRIFKYLRCDPLSTFDIDILGGLLTPRLRNDDPERLLNALARLIYALYSGTLVICLDQLEDIRFLPQQELKFQRAMQAAVTLAEHPNVIVVIACLDTFYDTLRDRLPKSYLARIEIDPTPINLHSQLRAKEIEVLIQLRLAKLFAEKDVAIKDDEPIYPFPVETPKHLASLAMRNVLDWCRQKQLESMATGKAPTLDDAKSFIATKPLLPPTDLKEHISNLPQHWNDYLTKPIETPTEDVAILSLLNWAIKQCSKELSAHLDFATKLQNTQLEVDISASEQLHKQLHLKVCNKAAGKALMKQVSELEKSVKYRVPVAIRSSDFPSNPKTLTAKLIGEFLSRGGKRVIVSDADLRAMKALQSFLPEHKDDLELEAWLKSAQPLSHLPSLKQLLDLEYLSSLKTTKRPERSQSRDKQEITKLANESTTPKQSIKNVESKADLTANLKQSSTKTPSPPPKFKLTDIKLGMSQGYQSQPVKILPKQLLRHSAFLGASGSGKTTLALNIIEQLLLGGIPAILIDRKGDLCSYANPKAWQTNFGDTNRKALRDQLKDSIEVAIYTPGTRQGRPLSIPIAPLGIGHLPSSECQKIANFSAHALSGIMGYRAGSTDQAKIAILSQAIFVLSQLEPDKSINLKGLLDFISYKDPSLINAVGSLDKHFDKLVQDLQTQNILKGNLFAEEGEQLEVAKLLGNNNHTHASKTPLSVINTSFLGDNTNALFWVAQLLLQVSQYVVKHPSSELQAVIMFDEADMYLPAQSKPATKEPLESLLKRARSAGLGLMLATQSPGDLDYKSRDQITTWFVGKVKEATAIKKLKPMLSEAKIDISDKLASQGAGEFYLLQEGNVTGFKADMSLIRAEQVPADEILTLAGS